MHPRSRVRRTAGFSLIELAALMVIGGMLLFVLSAYLPRSHNQGQYNRIACANNLKQVGIALRTYAVDSNDAYPWHDPKRPGETNVVVLEASYTNRVSADLLGYFATLSNELSTPKIVICPSDMRPTPRTNSWSYLQAHPDEGHRIPSYFLGLDATEERPESILIGDRNLTNGAARPLRWNEVTEKTSAWNPAVGPAPNRFERAAGYKGLGFDGMTIHKSAGNLLLGDGSAHKVTNRRLRDAVGAAAKVASPTWLVPVDH